MSLTSATTSATTYRNIVLTMLVSFAASFALLYWKQKTRGAPVLQATSLVPRQLQHPLPAAARSPAPSIAAAVAPQAPASAVRAEESGALPLPLPVLLTVTRQTTGRDEADSPGEAPSGMAHLVNSSDRDVAVTVVSLNPSTQQTSQAQVFLGANAEGHAGPDEGLKIYPGDRITLHSEGFTDLELTAP
jgi:hypothetical protein